MNRNRPQNARREERFMLQVGSAAEFFYHFSLALKWFCFKSWENVYERLEKFVTIKAVSVVLCDKEFLSKRSLISCEAFMDQRSIIIFIVRGYTTRCSVPQFERGNKSSTNLKTNIFHLAFLLKKISVVLRFSSLWARRRRWLKPQATPIKSLRTCINSRLLKNSPVINRRLLMNDSRHCNVGMNWRKGLSVIASHLVSRDLCFGECLISQPNASWRNE